MTILIDADGCPVVDITVKMAAKLRINCVILCDASHVFEKPGVKTITVSTGSDSVDFALVNMVQAGDVVVTQDYGLAAMCLARRAVPLSQNGMVYTNDNIDALLHERHISKKIRMSGGRLKGPSKRTAEQDATFTRVLKAILTE
ncbi:MAG: YaiI/YqxD family protein [Clostridiales bacterium]|nr:YaiI/YqxD family protein [Clostridiales bacterium]